MATRGAIMNGARLAAERQIELAMFAAYEAARLSTFTDKLDPLGKYLDQLKPPKPRRRQTPAEMIAALRAITASVAN